MTTLSLTLHPETAADGPSIQRLHERAFGPGRFARTAFRLREGGDAYLDLCFTARVGTLLVGSIRLSAVMIGCATPAVLLGPITIDPAFQGRGIGSALIERAMGEARAKGHRMVLLVGDAGYYNRFGFKPVSSGTLVLPGPVDPARLLIAELFSGAADGVSGPVRPAPVRGSPR